MGDQSDAGLLRTLYPAADTGVYLDVAAVGIISSSVRAAMSQVAKDHEQRGMAAFEDWSETVRRTRTKIGTLVGGAGNRVAFAQNTSTGLAIVANGLEWRPGDNVVVPEQEFPSNFYPWLQLRGKGVEVREVPMDDGQARFDQIDDMIDQRTRLLAISAVQYSSGFRYDLERLGRRLQDSNALFVVDGTQAAGAMLVEADDWGIDVLAVSAHKWMLGPLGVGFVHLSDRAMGKLAPSVTGWMSVESPFDMDHEPKLAKDGRRFESGTLNITGIAGLEVAIDHVLSLGRARVEQQILDRTEHLAAVIERKGWTVYRADRREAWSGIVIATTGTDDVAMHERLQSAGVRCSLRGGTLRFSPHYYTSCGDIEELESLIRQ